MTVMDEADTGAPPPERPHRGGDSDALHERRQEIALVAELLDSTLAGRGAALVFTGEAGVGKSTLLNLTAQLAERQGIRVLRASGVEFEAAVSFAALQQLLLPVLTEVRELDYTYRTTLTTVLGLHDGPVQTLRQVRDAAVQLIAHSARLGPLLLVVDDLQWLDRSTGHVITALAGALRRLGVGLIGAGRGDGGLPLLTDIVQVSEVAPLSAGAAATLLTEAFPELAPPVRERLLADARGNPLALLELPTALTAGQRLSAERLPPVLPLTRRLQEMFDDRLGRLPTATRRLLLMVALEPSLGVESLDLACGEATLEIVAEPAVRSGLVRVDSRLHLRHPLVGAAVVAAATAEERATAHRALGRVLDRGDPAGAGRAAWHRAEAADGPDEQIASALERAAEQVHHRGDGTGAMRLLQRAAELSTTVTERVRRLSRAAYAGATVDLAAAAEIIEEIKVADPTLRQSLTTTVAAATVIGDGDGDVDLAHRLLSRAIATYPNRTDPDDAILIEAIGTLRWVCWLGGRGELWHDYYAAVRRLDPAPPPLVDLASRSSSDPARTSMRRWNGSTK